MNGRSRIPKTTYTLCQGRAVGVISRPTNPSAYRNTVMIRSVMKSAQSLQPPPRPPDLRAKAMKKPRPRRSPASVRRPSRPSSGANRRERFTSLPPQFPLIPTNDGGRLAGRSAGRTSAQRQAELAKLPLVHRRGRPGERVRARCGLGKRDNLTDRVRTQQPLHQPVDAVGDPSVRRLPVAQRVEQEPEPLARLLGRDTDHAEDLLLHRRVRDADGPSAHLLPVPDDVVGLGASLSRVLWVELALRPGKRVVQGVPALVLGAPFEHRPVDDPYEVLALKQPEALAEVEPKLAEHGVGDRLVVGHQQEEIALLGAERLVDCAQLLLGQELRRRR